MSNTGKRSNIHVAESLRGEKEWDKAIPGEIGRLLQ